MTSLSLIHPCQKRPFIPLKFEAFFNYDIFHGGTKLTALPRVSPIFNYDIFSRWNKVTRMAQVSPLVLLFLGLD